MLNIKEFNKILFKNVSNQILRLNIILKYLFKKKILYKQFV